MSKRNDEDKRRFHRVRVFDPKREHESTAIVARFAGKMKLPEGVLSVTYTIRSPWNNSTYEATQSLLFPVKSYTRKAAEEWVQANYYMEKIESKTVQLTDIKMDAQPRNDSAGGVVRHDVGEIVGGVEMTSEGFLKTDAVVTRTGVLNYRNPDGTLRRELRHPDDVFKLDSLHTMRMIPLTNDHPRVRLLDSENAKEFQVGFTGENVRPDGRFVRAPLTITDEAVVRAVESGKRELSLGYRVDLVEEDGEYNGERYDYRQTNIRYNHLALVDFARAGAESRIEMDHADAVEIDSKKQPHTPKPTTSKRRTGMPHINLDNGLSYEVDSAEVVVAFGQLKADKEDLQTKLDAANAELEKTKAELDTSKARVDELEKVDVAAEAKKLADARVDCITKAKKVLDKEELEKLDGAAVVDIKKAVISKRFPEAKLDDATDVYIDTRFDTIIDLAKEDGGDDTGGNADDAAARQRKAVQSRGDSGDKGEPDADSARKSMQNSRRDAWKNEKKD